MSAPRAIKHISALLAILALVVILFWALLRANAAWHFYVAQTIAEPLFETGGGAATVLRNRNPML